MPVLITGMHRSGTSMVTRMLNLCGLYLGDDADMLTPNPANPEGFWELVKVNHINDELLLQLGGNWDRPPLYLPTDSQYRAIPDLVPLLNQVDEVIKSFEGHKPWGMKDPRFCFLLDLWRSEGMADDLKVVICLRNPLNSTTSLTSRGTPSDLGIHGWSSYYRYLFEQLKDTPFIVTHYETFFSQPQAELERLNEFLGLQPGPDTLQAALGFAKAPLRRHQFGDEDLLYSDTPLYIVEQYFELCRQAGRHYAAVRQEQLAATNPALLEVQVPFNDALKAEILMRRLQDTQLALRELRKEHQQLRNDHYSLGLVRDRLVEDYQALLGIAEERERIIREQATWAAQLEQAILSLQNQPDSAANGHTDNFVVTRLKGRLRRHQG